MLRGKLNRALVLPLCLLSGCATTPKIGGDPALTVLPGNELPAPGPLDMTAATSEYYVGPFDKLSIDVFGIEDLSDRTIQVDASGKIRYPLVGELAVSGMTVNQIAGLLSRELQAHYIRDPQVIVNLAQGGSQAVTIEGLVEKPGLYPVMGRMSLMRAMALAGGTDDLANSNDIVIFRTVNGQKLAALYSLKAIRHGAYPDPEVYPNDVISVGEDRTRMLFKDVFTTFPVILLVNQLTQ